MVEEVVNQIIISSYHLLGHCPKHCIAWLNHQSILFAMIFTTKCSLNICKTTLHARLEPIIYWISFSYKGHINIDTTLTTRSTKFGKKISWIIFWENITFLVVYYEIKMKDRTPLQIALISYSSSTRFATESILIKNNIFISLFWNVPITI